MCPIPGYLSSTINLQAIKDNMPFGSTFSVQSCSATEARALQSSVDCVPKDTCRHFQLGASTSEGTVVPSILRVTQLDQ